MVKIEKKCGNCGKFEVPAEHRHLVKPSQMDRVCSCADGATVSPFLVAGLAVAVTVGPPLLMGVAAVAPGSLLIVGWLAGAAAFLFAIFLAVRLAIAPLAKR